MLLTTCSKKSASPDVMARVNGRDIKRVVFVHLAGPHWENLTGTRRLAAKMLPDLPRTFARDFEEIGF